MRQVSDFTTLLTKKVNLPDGKLETLDDRVLLIFDALEQADLGTEVLGLKKQGSWAQETIINPKKDEEFDADFMVELEEQDGWSPSDYQQVIYDALDAYCVAQNMSTPAEAKNRCVRVTYANDMHIDVVPYVNRVSGGECIVNTDDDEWEDTDPDGFTAWMKKKDDLTGGNMRRVLRLLKYLRDHHDYFENTKSVILTTIVGGVITQAKKNNDPGHYVDVPTTLKNVVNDLADWVRYMPTRPEVDDPSRADATFTHRWPQYEYDEFRRDIQTVADLINDAYDCPTPLSESTKKWQELFGTGFGQTGSSTGSKFGTTGGAAGTGGSDTSTGRTGRAG